MKKEIFLQKLSRINFTDVYSNKLIGDPFDVHIEFNPLLNVDEKTPYQVSLSVIKGDRRVYSWGACDTNDNAELTRWFREHRYIAIANRERLSNDVDAVNKTTFNNL